jgi:GTPase SAR1 family protein
MSEEKVDRPVNIVFLGNRHSGITSLIQKIVRPWSGPVLQSKTQSTTITEFRTILIQKKPMELDSVDSTAVRPRQKIGVNYIDGPMPTDEEKLQERLSDADIVVYCVDLQSSTNFEDLKKEVLNDLKMINKEKPNAPIIVASTKLDGKTGILGKSLLWDKTLKEQGYASVGCSVQNNNMRNLLLELKRKAFEVAEQNNLVETIDLVDAYYPKAKETFLSTLDELHVSDDDREKIDNAINTLEKSLGTLVPTTSTQVEEILNKFITDCDEVKLSAKPKDGLRNAVRTFLAAIMVTLLAIIGVAAGVAFGSAFGAIPGVIIAVVGIPIVVGVGLNNSFFKPQRAIPQFVNDIKNTETVSGGLSI